MSRVVENLMFKSLLLLNLNFYVEPNYGPELHNSCGSLALGGQNGALISLESETKEEVATLLGVTFLVFHEPHEQRNPHRAVSSAADDTSLGVGFLRPNRVR